MMRFFASLLLVVVVAAPLSASQEGIIVRSATVYADAVSGARKVGNIPAGTRVSIFERRGGWKEVFSETPELIGWVRSFQVREGEYSAPAAEASESDSRGFLSGLAAFSRKASRFFSPQSGAATGSATIGVRGLSEEELRAAKPDLAELAKMQGFASDRARLERFRKAGQLSAQDVGHIKVKKKKRKEDSKK